MDEATFQELAATAEVMGVQLTGPALELMANDLGGYDSKLLRVAFSRLRKDGARFTIGEIVKRLPGMWPGAEQAWATFPRHEDDSACVCQEMLTAWGVASELDDIAGRMAFRETYNRLVSEAMAEGRMPQWSMSLGHDPDRREQATLDAIFAGLLSVDAAAVHLPNIPASELHQLAGREISSHRLLEKHAATVTSVDQLMLAAPERTHADIDAGLQHLANIRAMLGIGKRTEAEVEA